jgi:hypothetical protein
MNSINTIELNKIISQLELAIPDFEKINPSISNSNVGWHIEHALLVLNGIIETTSKSNPNDYTWSFNFKRLVVFTKNKIPRGVAKAPKSVIPKGDYTAEHLSELLNVSKNKLEDLQNMDPKLFFKHPGLGNLKFKQMVKFLAIHTKHHLDIIHDIIKSEK